MRLAALLAILAGLWVAAPASAQIGQLTLQPERLPGMCIAMDGRNGEALSRPCNGQDDEKFYLPGPEGGPIRYADKCLVPQGDGNYPPLVAAVCDGSPEQTWTLNDKAELRSGAGRCVSLLGGSSRTGEMIFAATCPTIGDGHGWVARRVDFTNVVEASLESEVRPGQCIGYDIQLALYPCTDAYRQLISFDEKAIGQLRMMSSCLSGGFVFGALRLGECSDQLDQKWLVFEDGRVGNARLQCIEISVEGGRDVLRTKTCGAAPEQKWRVRYPPASRPAPTEAADEPAPPEAAPPAVDASLATPIADPVATLAEPIVAAAAQPPEPAPPVATKPADDIIVTSDAAPVAPKSEDIAVTSVAPDPAASQPEPAPAIVAAVPAIAEPTPAPVIADAAASTTAPPATEPAVAAPTPAAAVASVAPPVAAAATPAAASTATPAPPAHAVTPAMTLQHEQLPGMCISLSGPAGESESRPCDGSAIQTFVLPVGGPGPIRSADRCLAPRGKGMYPQLAAVACDGAPEQTWTITPDGEFHSANGRCLSLLGNSSRSGERVYAGECPSGLPAARWHAVAVDPATAKPVTGMLESAARPGKCLGTDGALGLVACDARLGRVFSFDQSGPSQFRMMSSCLAGGYAADTLALGQCWNMPAQKWSLNAAGNLANLEGKCISVAVEGARDVLRAGTCLPAPEQQWTLKEVSP